MSCLFMNWELKEKERKCGMLQSFEEKTPAAHV